MNHLGRSKQATGPPGVYGGVDERHLLSGCAGASLGLVDFDPPGLTSFVELLRKATDFIELSLEVALGAD